MSSASYSVPADVRREIRDHGARRALRSAMYEIEKIGIERQDFARVKKLLEGMIQKWPDT